MAEETLSLQSRDRNGKVAEISDLDELEVAFALGHHVTLVVNGNSVVGAWEFKQKDAGRPHAMYIHGSHAYNLEQVLSYMSGDAHDQSKVQWYDGEKFYDLF